MPGKRSSPEASRARRLSRISALTVFWICPLSRRAPSVAALTSEPYACGTRGWQAKTAQEPPDWTRSITLARRAKAGRMRDDDGMAYFGDGLATGPRLHAAAREAVDRALAPLGARPDLLAAFVSGPHPDEIGAGVPAVRAQRCPACPRLQCVGR